MNAIAIHRPGLLGHKVINEMFDSFFNDFPSHLKQSTQGYPVADIYRDDDGSTVLEFALAGFKRKELTIDVQPDKRSITIKGTADEDNLETKSNRSTKLRENICELRRQSRLDASERHLKMVCCRFVSLRDQRLNQFRFRLNRLSM